MDAISNNPFRILALPVTATEREIAKQVSTLLTYAEMGKSKTFDTDFPFFPAVNRTPEVIEEARKKIEQTENKMFNSLFWFWINNPTDEQAMTLLKEGKTADAVATWEKAIFSEKKTVYKEIIIHDNLISSSKEWSTEKDADHKLEKIGGNYSIDRIKNSSTSVPVVAANLDNNVQDWLIEADTTWISGVDNVGYGIIFGREKGNYFSFDIAADGNYSFSKYVDWNYEKKIGWTRNDAIKVHGENRITIKKVGKQFTFYINGTAVDSCPAEPLFGKYFGFKVTNNQKVIFRNFKFAQLVQDNAYGVGIPVNDQNLSCIKNLSVLYLSQAINNGGMDHEAFKKGISLGSSFYHGTGVNEYARRVAGDKYIWTNEKSLAAYISELTESLKPVLDKPNGVPLGGFISLFNSYPGEAKQFLIGRYMSGRMQNVEKAIENCAAIRKSDPTKGVIEGHALIEKTRADMEFLLSCSGAQDVQYQVTADKLSGELVQCGIDYFNKMKDDAPCLPLYQFARSIAGSISAIQKAQENLDSCIEWMKTGDQRNCWFCGKNPPSPHHKFSHTIYRVNSRGYRSVQYSYVPIEINRCQQCQAVHSKGNTILTLCIILPTLLGLFLGNLFDEHFVIGGLVGLGAGIATGITLKNNEIAKAQIRNTSDSTIKTYPLIAKMLKEGWQMSKPSP